MTARTLVPADRLAKMAISRFAGESVAYHVLRRLLLAEKIEFRRHMTRPGEQR